MAFKMPDASGGTQNIDPTPDWVPSGCLDVLVLAIREMPVSSNGNAYHEGAFRWALHHHVFGPVQ
ncbi:hypothetical protein GE21DRAFT_1290818 [Neurospora crassa]|nr:hypothetical protein GE21DRAFT_1290818 [Neurospora crassa]